MARNPVTARKIADLLERARLQFLQTHQKARFLDDGYYAAVSWDELRRFIMEAEWLLKGTGVGLVLHQRNFAELSA